MPDDPHNFPGSLEEFEKKQRIKQATAQGKKSKGNLIVTIIVVFIALDIGAFVFLSAMESDLPDMSKYWQLLSATPFWVIIAIIFIVNRKKNKK